MPWNDSDRRSRLPKDWPQKRRAVLARDRGRCQEQGCPEKATDVDHINPGDDHSLSNLQALCGYHHTLKSRREGNAAQKKKLAELRARTKRPVERHPGAIPFAKAKPRRNKGW